MIRQFDSELNFTWEVEAFNAEECAEYGEMAKTVTIRFDEHPDLNKVEEAIKEYNKAKGTNIDSFEFVKTEIITKRYSII